jgi:hypothetical protein
MTLLADGMGFLEITFARITFESGKWRRGPVQTGCFTYTATQDGAEVIVDRLIFRAKKGLTVTACGAVAAFDEGFEAANPQ